MERLVVLICVQLSLALSSALAWAAEQPRPEDIAALRLALERYFCFKGYSGFLRDRGMDKTREGYRAQR
ncbi:MAG: hypothetical protein N3C12_12720 [Candidatus Binatia bacterium]|nr:hypothetical protein [Candidatus Binatia bacterium]